MMELATGLLRCAVMVFMSISLVLSICLFHLVSSPVSGSLQMLFLYSKMITLNSKWITVPFLCWQVLPKSVKRFFSFFYLNNFWWRLVFFINFSLVSDLVIQQSTNWFSLYKREVRVIWNIVIPSLRLGVFGENNDKYVSLKKK